MSNTPDRITAAFDQVKKDLKTLLSTQTYEHLSQNQIIGGLTVLLLVVGIATGVYLGQSSQETRRQASGAYSTCATPSYDTLCSGKPVGYDLGCPSGQSCQNTETDPKCHCAGPSSSVCGTASEASCAAPKRPGDSCTASNGTPGTCTANSGGTCGCIPNNDPGLCGSASEAACSPNLNKHPGDSCTASNGFTGTCQANSSGTCGCFPPEGGTCSVVGTGGSQDSGHCFISCPSGSTGNGLGSGGCPTNQQCCTTATTCADRGGTCTLMAECPAGTVLANPQLACPNNVEAVCCMPQATQPPVNDCYQSCIAAGDNPGSCAGLPQCPPCRERCNSQYSAATSYCNTLRSCGSPDCPGQPSGSFCAEPGGSCGPGSTPVSGGCENVGGTSCCPVGSNPTNTPVVVPPTDTPVVNPTNPPATDTPRPTNRPTNTPTQTPTITPGGPSLTPTNTPVLGPICVNVTMNTPNNPPSVGDLVTLSCSPVAGAQRYEFRMKLPDLTYVDIDPSNLTITNSVQYQIPGQSGDYIAACRPCLNLDPNDDSTCANWQN